MKTLLLTLTLGLVYIAPHSVSVSRAASVDITGQNGWYQYPGFGSGPILATDLKSFSGNGSMMFDATAGGTVVSAPGAPFITPLSSGIVTYEVKIYLPSTGTGAWLMGTDEMNGSGGNMQISSYFPNATTATGQLDMTNPTGTGFSWQRDVWQTFRAVIDLDSVAGAGQFFLDGVLVGTADYGTVMSEVWFLSGNDFNGTPVSEPFFFDDIVVMQGSTVVFSENFDSYITVVPVPEPSTYAVMAFAAFGLARRRITSR